MSTRWPSPGDYSTAIQNPQVCFSDPLLKQGKVTTNRLGLPIGMSGNFAVVYQVRCGPRTYAIRCFIRPVTNQQQRYQALSAYLQNRSVPYLADFVYLPEGILVQGRRYPIVRMEWVSGKPLHHYVEECIKNGHTDKLDHLATLWLEVVADLHQQQLAHGDLQHGNVLIDDHLRIRLVDYDGFWAPPLQSYPPPEGGHPNYQHPERNSYYARNIDAFSARVIYLSLKALRHAPNLWSQFHNGENLIFLAHDFQNPGQTQIWKRLQTIQDGEVQGLTAELIELCKRPVSSLPPIATAGQPNTSAQTTSLNAPTSTSANEATVVCPNCGQRNSRSEIYCQYCNDEQPLCAHRWCPYCGQKTPLLGFFCILCGKQFQPVSGVSPSGSSVHMGCKTCKRRIARSIRFCPYCGTPVRTGSSSMAPPSGASNQLRGQSSDSNTRSRLSLWSRVFQRRGAKPEPTASPTWPTEAVLAGHTSGVFSVAFSPEGRWLASASLDHTVKLWAPGDQQAFTTLNGHTDAVYSVRFSQDGRWLASGSEDKAVMVWQTGDWQRASILRGHTKGVLAVSFSPNGRWLASGSEDRTIKIWQQGGWQEVVTLKGHGDWVHSVVFSTNGVWLASASADTTVKVWQVGTWQEVASLEKHADSVFSVAFSPDGRWLASGSADNTVKVWQVSDWRKVAVLEGHSDWVRSVIFSPDGEWLASVSWDGMVRVWAVRRWQAVATLRRHPKWPLDVAFSPDGHTWAFALWDGTVQLRKWEQPK